MPQKAMIKVLCILFSLMLLSVWLLADTLLSHEQSQIKLQAVPEITAAEACNSALWSLRCAREAAFALPPVRSVRDMQPSVQILRVVRT